MGFLYILPLLTHILWSRKITVNVCIYLFPTLEHRLMKYVNIQAHLLCKYVIGVIHIFKSVRFEIGTWWVRLMHFDLLSLRYSRPACTSLYHNKYFYTLFLELRGVPFSAGMVSDPNVYYIFWSGGYLGIYYIYSQLVAYTFERVVENMGARFKFTIFINIAGGG